MPALSIGVTAYVLGNDSQPLKLRGVIELTEYTNWPNEKQLAISLQKP